MANLKEVRERISSVINTQQITKAMKLVSASKLKRAQDRITQMRPYSIKLTEILSNVMESLEGEEIDLNFSEKRDPKNVLVVLLTSDKGLCGAFNTNLIKAAKRLVNEEYAEQAKAGNLTLMPLGKKGFDAFKNTDIPIIKDNIDIFTKQDFNEVGKVAQSIMDEFLSGRWDVVRVCFAEFKNAATQNFDAVQYLPIPKIESETEETRIVPDYIYEPEKKELLEILVPKILKTQFYRFILDNFASEHGARMVAMDKATENANELLKDLRLAYNRERQAAITTEILEIVAGAAALENG